jgi:N-acetylglucosamine transport system permease protein
VTALVPEIDPGGDAARVGLPAKASVLARRRKGGPRDGRPGRTLTFDYVSFMFAFLVVPVALFLVFVIWPFGQAVFYAMTDWSGFSADYNFIGFDNFTRLWDDKLFKKAVRNNVLLAIIVPIVTITIALTFASMMTIGGSRHGQMRGLRNSSFYRVVSFFPYVVPAIVIGLIWSQIYNPRNGLLNGVLTKLSFGGFENFTWLGETSTARWATIFAIIWGFVGFYMVLFIASIKGVPAEIYEAARIDGAGRFRLATSVTIPMIRDSIQTAYIYLGILALDAFVYMEALTPAGGPDNTTLTMSQMLFRTAFEGQPRAGYASAMGVVLAIVTLVFASIVFIVNRLTGGRSERRRA